MPKWPSWPPAWEACSKPWRSSWSPLPAWWRSFRACRASVSKSAQRLAYHIIGMPLEDVRELAGGPLSAAARPFATAAVCGNYSQPASCAISVADERRRNGQICVVRDPRDVAAIERMHDFHG